MADSSAEFSVYWNGGALLDFFFDIAKYERVPVHLQSSVMDSHHCSEFIGCEISKISSAAHHHLLSDLKQGQVFTFQILLVHRVFEL